MLRKSSFVKTVALIVLLSLCLMLLMPSVAFAFNIFRGIKKLVGFVVKVPEKLTRPLGPLAPIAQIWLLRKIPKFGHIVKKASEIKAVSDDIDQQKKKVREVRSVYRSQAQTFRSRATSLETKRKALAKELVKNKLEWNDYKGKVAAIQQMINSLNTAAGRLDEKASKLRTKDIISLFANRAADTLLANAQGLVVQEIASEIDGLVNPVIISAFLDGGLKVDNVIDHFINGDIERLINDKGLGKRPDIKNLRQRLRDRVKAGVKDDIDFLKDNWAQELEAMMDELMTEADRAERLEESNEETAAQGEPPDAQKYDPKSGPVYVGEADFDDVLPRKDGQLNCPQRVKVTIQMLSSGQVRGGFYTFKSYPIIPLEGCVDMPPDRWDILGSHKNGGFEASVKYLKLKGSVSGGTLMVEKSRGPLSQSKPNDRYFTIESFILVKQ